MLWRCALVTLGCDPLRFARPLHTLAEKAPSLQIEYDASLKGLGILLSELSDTGDTRLLYAVKLPLPFDLDGDSSYQKQFRGIHCDCSRFGLFGGPRLQRPRCQTNRRQHLVTDMGFDGTISGGQQPPRRNLLYGFDRDARFDHFNHRTRCRRSEHSVRLTFS